MIPTHITLALRNAVSDKNNRTKKKEKLRANIEELARAGKPKEAALCAFFLGCTEICSVTALRNGTHPNTLRAGLTYTAKHLNMTSCTVQDLMRLIPEAFRTLPSTEFLTVLAYVEAVLREHEAFQEFVKKARNAGADDFMPIHHEFFVIMASL